jgi:hypothetical protein
MPDTTLRDLVLKRLDADTKPAACTAELTTTTEQSIVQLVISVDQLDKVAAQELTPREDTWRPHAVAVARWLPNARKARTSGESLQNLKAADKWLKGAADAVREERCAPIAQLPRRIWDQLRPRATSRSGPLDGGRRCALVAAVQAGEEQLVLELRRPSDEDREQRVAHVVAPVFVGTLA